MDVETRAHFGIVQLISPAVDGKWRALCRRRSPRSSSTPGVGTANPANCVAQEEYPDWYFRVTKSDHLADLKAKMKRMCDKSAIKKRHFYHSEEMIAGHPEFINRAAPSLDARLSIAKDAVPELAMAAAARAIAEWGRPATDITHLVVSTNSGAHSPGADVRLAALLGLRPTVQHTVIYLHGCSTGCSALRLAKDIAENNRGARVLVACAEVTLLAFMAPDEAHLDTLVAMSLFGDGAGAVVLGADPRSPVECPIFHMVSTSQAIIPGTEERVSIEVSERGLDYKISGEVPALVRASIERCLADALAPLGLTAAGGGWDHLFWAMHPGGRAILDSYEAGLRLEPRKLTASRRVLREYGNMSGAAIFFVLDEIRRRHRCGEEEEPAFCGCEWGALVGLGPGLTVETTVVRAAGGRDDGNEPIAA
ncbi:bisdemethoxycurcumin synthase-like [Oryza brachyantha]|uniref:bisdemethoxycurcumin synthase-like n=1 Tax=Oryza brachyantha TaxID=4533 RepID=UPI001ADA7243|nr:bisdemethoxycurcumin synthase-like [Oryza brachyantha]